MQAWEERRGTERRRRAMELEPAPKTQALSLRRALLRYHLCLDGERELAHWQLEALTKLRATTLMATLRLNPMWIPCGEIRASEIVASLAPK